MKKLTSENSSYAMTSQPPHSQTNQLLGAGSVPQRATDAEPFNRLTMWENLIKLSLGERKVCVLLHSAV